MKQNEIIFQVGAAGGSITIHGIRTSCGWLFSRQVIDQTPELIGESWIQNKSELIDSWQSALELMDQYPWYRLSPQEVHGEFKELVWAAVVSRYEQVNEKAHRNLSEWKELCLGDIE